jgi:membrane protein
VTTRREHHHPGTLTGDAMATMAANFFALVQRSRQWFDNILWQEYVGQLPWWRRVLIRTAQISYAVLRDLSEGQLSLRAMSLVYYTVIASIPLLALTFSVLKGLGAHNAMEPALLSVLAPLGERSPEVTASIIQFVDNVRVDVLSILSLGVLLYTVLRMMQSIELSFNFIWEVDQARNLASRISEYLFAIIVSPLLIFISVGITSYVNTNFFARYVETLSFGSSLLQLIAFVTPFFFMSFAFALAYTFIPNTRVRFSSAFIAGIMTAIIWRIMGWMFQSFFASDNPNAIIYLAFFTVILVMIFVYIAWLVLLVGSSIAYYHQYPERARIGHRRVTFSLAQQEEVALTIAYLIVIRFHAKAGPWSAAELARHLQLSQLAVNNAIDLLAKTDFVLASNEDPPRYLPCYAVEDVSILELRTKIRSYTEPAFQHYKQPPAAQARISQFMREIDTVLDHNLGNQHFLDLAIQSHPEDTHSSDKSSSATKPGKRE